MYKRGQSNMQYKKKSKNPANSGMEVIRNSFGVNIVINLFFKANSLPGFGKIIKKAWETVLLLTPTSGSRIAIYKDKQRS